MAAPDVCIQTAFPRLATSVVVSVYDCKGVEDG
jgi:hypothetical protein